MRAPPAFQMYASDTLSDENFKLATMAERGLYWSMLMQCWVSDGVPSDRVELARVLGITLADVEQGLTKRVLSFFEIEGSRLRRRELVEQKETMMLRRREQSRGGRSGAKSRWTKGNQVIAMPLGKPMASEKKRAERNGSELSASIDHLRPSEIADIEAFKVGLGK